jgi:SAM-dependent methyltransferase
MAMRVFWDDSARRRAACRLGWSAGQAPPEVDAHLDAGRELVRALVDRSPVPPGGDSVAVEIGCGFGRVCVALADRFDRVVGVDISSEVVQRASVLVDHPRVSFRVGDGLRLRSFVDESVDLVLCADVFAHVPTAEVAHSYLAEAARVLRPGGLLAFQWDNQPGERSWAARRRARFLGTRIPLAHLLATLTANGMDLAGTRDLGTASAVAWAVRRADPVAAPPRGGRGRRARQPKGSRLEPTAHMLKY